MSNRAPQFAIAVAQDDATKKCVLMLIVSKDFDTYQTYLCVPDEAETMATLMHDQIVKAGKEARHLESGLVLVKGGLPDEGKPQQGGRKPRPRGPRPQGPRAA